MPDAPIKVKFRLRKPAAGDMCHVQLDVTYPDGSEADADDVCTVDSAKHRAFFHRAAETGKLLEGGLLPGAVGKLFEDVLKFAGDTIPVRVVLAIPTRRAADGEPAAWHGVWHGRRWETLWCSYRKRHLAQDERVHLSRLLSTDLPPFGPRPWEPLTSFVAVANPPCLDAGASADWQYDPAPGSPPRPAGDRRPLQPIVVKDEVAAAKTALAPFGPVEVLNGTGHFTLDELVAAVGKAKPHVLYLVAHGALDKGVPQLLLGTSKDPHECEVSAAKLVARLDGLAHRLRMVVLVSCESGGKGTGDEGVLAAAGPLFVAAGVPVVLAMQGNLGVDTARKFLPPFFETLRKTGQVDHAAAVARLRAADCDDFWSPVVFCRVADGCLWVEARPPARPADRTSGFDPKYQLKLLLALQNLPCVRTPATFARVLAGAAGYGVDDPAAPTATTQLADAWLAGVGRLGALPEVLDYYERPDPAGPAGAALDAFYALLDAATWFPVPWGELAKLKRVFPADFAVPARVVREFCHRYPAHHPAETDAAGRPVVRAWLEQLAQAERTDAGGGPLHDFLALLRARVRLDDYAGFDAAVAAWVGQTRVHDWPPPAAAAPAAADLTVVVEHGAERTLTARAWVAAGGETTSLTPGAPENLRPAALQKRIAGWAVEATRRVAPVGRPLVVEVFLPHDLLTEDVDAWPAAGGLLGTAYDLRVRLFERAYKAPVTPGEYESWLARWKARPAGGEKLDPAALCDDWGRLAETAGPAVAAADPANFARIDELWAAGYPVAVLARGVRRETAGLVTEDRFDALAGRVRDARGKGDLPAVTLLWDDPDYLPPDRRMFAQS